MKSDRHQTWHDDRERLQRLGVWRIVSPLDGTENLMVTRPRQIKTPVTP